ncbi:MAG: methyltransferase domain-containing protein [Deltaproteobacteria bacterium]|nr:methyltransferase domain-containing protein [Deltaproteobacteria bacterium]
MKIYDLDYLINIDNESILYNEVSSQFDAITRGFYAQANNKLLEKLAPKADSRIVEFCCGTGNLALQMAKMVPQGKVLGVDMSSQMIAEAKKAASEAGIQNAEFIQKKIEEILPKIHPGNYDIGISCFALSYLGCEFALKSFHKILGNQGQVGITTSSGNSLVEWQPLFMEFISEHMELIADFDIHELPDIPADPEDMKTRMIQAGFKNPQVEPLTISFQFKNAEEAASYLISAGWLSNYFFRVKDKKLRREFLDWGIQRVDSHHQNDPHIAASIEFLVAWNVL